MFGLPFVSRASHDRELAALERLLAHAEQRADDAKAEAAQATRLHELESRRYDLLLAKYTDALAPKPPIVTSAGMTVKPREKDIVAEKIRAEAGGDVRLIAHWNKLASELRGQGKTAEEIEGMIGWQTGDPEPVT